MKKVVDKPRKIYMRHRGIEFVIYQSEDDFCRFEFKIADTVVKGKTQTKLTGWAVRRAQRVINWKLKQIPQPQDV